MKILILILILWNAPLSERKIDTKDCTLWQYTNAQTHQWCLKQKKIIVLPEFNKEEVRG